MKTRKVYVGQDNQAVLLCPHCGGSKPADASRYRDLKDPVKVVCACGETFYVSFEFRKAYRKETNLVGHYCKWPGSKDWAGMVVKNISPTGLGFETIAPHRLREGNTVRVKFRLDDAKRSDIEKTIIVKEVKDHYVGCEFSTPLQFGRTDKALGFYLMP